MHGGLTIVFMRIYISYRGETQNQKWVARLCKRVGRVLLAVVDAREKVA